MNIFGELFAKLHIAREHMTSEYRLREDIRKLDNKVRLLMDNTIDIRMLKPATGGIRLRQEIGIQILRAVDALATRYHIPYWLDFGTLLGAVRHQGFIPWDDDIDISMPREAAEKFYSLQNELPQSLGVSRDSILDVEMDPIIHVYEKRSRCFVDIFPYDRIKGAISAFGSETEWAKEYSKAFETLQANNRRREILSFRDAWLSAHPLGQGDVDAFVVGLDYASAAPNYRNIFNVSKVFPLQKVTFEGCKLNAPADADYCLMQTYGDYMRFPADAGTIKHALCHHWASAGELRTVLDDLSSDVRAFLS